LRWGKLKIPFVIGNQCIPIKNTLGSSALVYVVRAVYKFNFRLLINEHLTNGDQWEKGNAVIQIHVFFK
jgi:hypothetical protein